MLSEIQKAFVAENIGLAVACTHKVLRRLPKKFLAFRDDFYSAAFVGLCEAAARYDASKSVFSSYAYIWMEREIALHIRTMTGVTTFNSHSGDTVEYRNRLEWEGSDSFPLERAARGPGAIEAAVLLGEIEKKVEELAKASKWKARDVEVWIDSLEGDGSHNEMALLRKKYGKTKQRLHQQKKSVERRVRQWAEAGVCL